MAAHSGALSLPAGGQAKSVRRRRPVAVSQRRTMPSAPAPAASLLSGLSATAYSQSSAPFNTCCCPPLPTSHRRIVWSAEAEASRLPSLLKIRSLTVSAWPSLVRVVSLLFGSHQRRRGSAPEETSRLPSGLTASARTPSSCPLKRRRLCPVAVS